MDRQTDRILITRLHLHYTMQHCKNTASDHLSLRDQGTRQKSSDSSTSYCVLSVVRPKYSVCWDGILHCCVVVRVLWRWSCFADKWSKICSENRSTLVDLMLVLFVWQTYIYTERKKTAPFYFCNNLICHSFSMEWLLVYVCLKKFGIKWRQNYQSLLKNVYTALWNATYVNMS